MNHFYTIEHIESGDKFATDSTRFMLDVLNNARLDNHTFNEFAITVHGLTHAKTYNALTVLSACYILHERYVGPNYPPSSDALREVMLERLAMDQTPNTDRVNTTIRNPEMTPAFKALVEQIDQHERHALLYPDNAMTPPTPQLDPLAILFALLPRIRTALSMMTVTCESVSSSYINRQGDALHVWTYALTPPSGESAKITLEVRQTFTTMKTVNTAITATYGDLWTMTLERPKGHARYLLNITLDIFSMDTFVASAFSWMGTIQDVLQLIAHSMNTYTL